ncbi:Lnb N-terminal periplasmic domain-containing protein [Solimonas marina]|uniref:DUF4105 domain-containing protein n=1 Tax=Solimonas marina TaxID=2714601 RepID=A0A969WB88_9GAMM|nr:DUF4105 domain-containing protein [Solimonas marina]
MALLMLLCVRPALAADEPVAPPVSLVTFGPGQTYWERFGHDALLVGDPANPDALLYNYGLFDFRQKNFFLNFARGKMMYRVAPEPFYYALRGYAAERRWVYLQRLDLDDAQRRELVDFLAWNVRPENAQYHYDYFISNCTTRVRDALDKASGGALSRAAKGVPTGRTYRFEATRLIAPDWPLSLAMDLGMGPSADKPLDLWAQAFVPMVLKDVAAKASVTAADGSSHPLVESGTWVLQSDAWPEPTHPPRWLLPLLAFGLVFAAVLWALDRARDHRAARWSFAILALGSSLVATVLGLVLVASWALTDHWAMWANRNLLLLDPLALLMIPAWCGAFRAAWRPRAWQRVVTIVVAAAATLSVPLLLLPGAQQNLPWIAALLPAHLVLAYALLRQPLRPR